MFSPWSHMPCGQKKRKKKKRYSLLLLLLWTSSDVSVCPPPVQVEHLPTCLAR